MKIYLVGGAVRDKALGLPVTERDWVVVGSSPHELLALGYQQVGRDFPVFLHPSTREEYALARTERKSARGYHGFECDFNPNVMLEDDLMRRDLTINAMAEDETGHLIDPYHGMRDVQEKCLRHVSEAFAEDPVRVLRIARFYARFFHLGFQIALDTKRLMTNMVRAGELNYLMPERVWQEWHAALLTKNPQQFINSLRETGALKVVIPELDGLFGIPNALGAEQYIDVGVQALATLKYASEQSADAEVRFAALLLEVGKQDTPKSQWPEHANFAICSKRWIDIICDRLRVPNAFRRIACLSAMLQLKIQRVLALEASEVVRVFEQADAFRRPAGFKQLLVVIQAQISAKYPTQLSPLIVTQWMVLLQVAQGVCASALTDSRDGTLIKQALYQRRVECVQQQLTQWKKDEK